MANVSLDNRCRPIVDITIAGPKGEKKLTAVIDTGFDGFLSAPSTDLEEIGLPKAGDPKVTGIFSLADNSQVTVELCVITVHLDDDQQMGMCVIAPKNGETLIGTTSLMMFKQRLILDIPNDSAELSPTAYKPAV